MLSTQLLQGKIHCKMVSLFRLLLQYYGLNNKKIPIGAERSPEKWGKYTISTGIKILSEEKARQLNPKYFFVMPYAFIKEFIKREHKWLKRGGKFSQTIFKFSSK